MAGENTNLLTETSEILAQNGKSGDEVRWVGSKDGRYAISWQEFASIAADVVYDSGYGGNEIASELVVVGDDWWLERGEYDGAEWWDFKCQPQRLLDAQQFNTVINQNYKDVLQFVVKLTRE